MGLIYLFIVITVPLESCISTCMSIGQPLSHTPRSYEINISPIEGVLRLLLRNVISLIKKKINFNVGPCFTEIYCEHGYSGN